jgi:hypothetical protein
MANNNNKRRQNNRSNPVSYNTTMSRTSPLTQQRVFSGKDLITAYEAETGSFGANDYPLNPRLEDYFPSANLMAQRYDCYQFEELAFHWHPTTAVTTSPGIVILGWEPNANRSVPDSLAQMNAFEHHSEGPIYAPNLWLRIPKSCLGGVRFCRDGPTGSDLNLYDTGRIVIASQNSDNSAGNDGYLEVYYRVRFFNYHLESNSPVQARCAEIVLITADDDQGASPVTDHVAFNSLREDFNGDFGDSLLSSGAITLPPGKYKVDGLINYRLTGAGGTWDIKVELQKDSAAVSPPIESVQHGSSSGATPQISFTFTGIVESDGTNAFRVYVDGGWTGPTNGVVIVGSRVIFSSLS